MEIQQEIDFVLKIVQIHILLKMWLQVVVQQKLIHLQPIEFVFKYVLLDGLMILLEHVPHYQLVVQRVYLPIKQIINVLQLCSVLVLEIQ